jgi:hypothetical protein
MTKHLSRALALSLAAAIAVLAPLRAAAMDIEASGFFGNLGLPWSGKSAMTADEYPADLWLYGGRVAFTEQLNTGLSFMAEYETDVVLRNVVRGIITYETGIVSISAGPMVGVFNSMEKPLKTGIDIGFRLELAGLAFFSATVESSMGMATAGGYFQDLTELSAGWNVSNAICSLTMTTRQYTDILDSGSISNASTDYMFAVDVYRKGAPYRVLAELGYRAMTKTYADATIDGLGAVVLGAQVSAQLNPVFSIIAGLDSGVYVFGLEELAGRGPAPESFMFQGSLGIVVHLGTDTESSPAQ